MYASSVGSSGQNHPQAPPRRDLKEKSLEIPDPRWSMLAAPVGRTAQVSQNRFSSASASSSSNPPPIRPRARPVANSSIALFPPDGATKPMPQRVPPMRPPARRQATSQSLPQLPLKEPPSDLSLPDKPPIVDATEEANLPACPPQDQLNDVLANTPASSVELQTISKLKIEVSSKNIAYWVRNHISGSAASVKSIEYTFMKEGNFFKLQKDSLILDRTKPDKKSIGIWTIWFITLKNGEIRCVLTFLRSNFYTNDKRGEALRELNTNARIFQSIIMEYSGKTNNEKMTQKYDYICNALILIFDKKHGIFKYLTKNTGVCQMCSFDLNHVDSGKKIQYALTVEDARYYAEGTKAPVYSDDMKTIELPARTETSSDHVLDYQSVANDPEKKAAAIHRLISDDKPDYNLAYQRTYSPLNFFKNWS